jgi:voltage-gated potassium channel Kch
VQLPRLTGFVARRLLRAFETGRILPFLLLTMMALVFVFGTLMWLLDNEDFPRLGPALWWAVATVTTVGYGDVVPREPHGRLLASLLMLLGFATLSLLTGTIASALVARQHGRTASTERELVAALERVERRLEELEARLGAS